VTEFLIDFSFKSLESPVFFATGFFFAAACFVAVGFALATPRARTFAVAWILTSASSVANTLPTTEEPTPPIKPAIDAHSTTLAIKLSKRLFYRRRVL
jgi:hypothetical protein